MRLNASAPGNQRSAPGSSHHEITELSAIMAVASCLARKGRARSVRQSCTIGPKRGCVSSHISQRTLPREKQKAASKTKGVVGNSGNTMPTTPTVRLKIPASNQAQRCQRLLAVDGGAKDDFVLAPTNF
jgi:hypothetical protein